MSFSLLFSKPSLIPNLDRMLSPWSSDNQSKISQLQSLPLGVALARSWRMEDHCLPWPQLDGKSEWWMNHQGTLREFLKTRGYYGWLPHTTLAEWDANYLFWDPGLTGLINSLIQSLIQPISKETRTHTREMQKSVPFTCVSGWGDETLINEMASGMETESRRASLPDCFSCPMKFSLTSQETSDLPCVCVCVLTRVRLLVTPWTVACQIPLSRQESWSRLPFPSSEDLSDPGIKLLSPASPELQVDSLPRATWEAPWSPLPLSKTERSVYICSGEIHHHLRW